MWVKVFIFDGDQMCSEHSKRELCKLSNYLTFLTESGVEYSVTWLQSATDTVAWNDNHYVDLTLTAIVTDTRVRPSDQ